MDCLIVWINAKKKQKKTKQTTTTTTTTKNVSGKIAAKTSMVKCLQRPVTFSH